jgi:hypothetical protein
MPNQVPSHENGQLQYSATYLTFMEPCIARCVFYITNKMQLIVFRIIISTLHVLGSFSAHHQELIKLYVQPWVLSCLAEQFQPIHTSGRQQESMTIPKAAHTVL